ncbi:MAG: hypothetical protein ACM31C_22655 [Acidobacteriota bacterium]
MSRILIASVLALGLFSCSKKETSSPTTPPTGSSTTGSGSAGSAGPAEMAGSGSGSAALAGSGSAAMAGSGSAAMAGSGSAGGEENEAKGSGGFDFDKLTHDQKMEFMKTKVVPVMKKEFQAFDAKRYANFGCKTCHGKDPKKTKYKMPNPELPKLDFAALKAGKQKPKVAEFMAKVVKPKMAEILQQPEMTETNPKGFGCLECHEQKKK